jgi:transcriptional regulator with XRE-family HTH domain
MEGQQNIEKKCLRAARRGAGLTQKGLAELIGLAQVHISLVERGKLTLLPHQRAAVESILGEIEWDQWYMGKATEQCRT